MVMMENGWSSVDYAADWSLIRAGVFVKYLTETPSALDVAQRIQSSKDQEYSDLNAKDIVACAVANLLIFIQMNFTGPDIEIPESLNVYEQDLKKSLESDGEEVYALAQGLHFLSRAKRYLALIDLEKETDNSIMFLTHFWTARAHFMHQILLEHESQTLLDGIELHMSAAEKLIPELEDISNDKQASFYLCWGLMHQHRRGDKISRVLFQKAQQRSGLEWNLTGALGKRTKFQQQDYAQLTLETQSANQASEKPNVTSAPASLPLNDDTLLENVEFTKATENVKLSSLDQCILLAFCLNLKNTNPDAGLTHEQMLPFVTTVLQSPQNWLIHTKALLIRSRLESTKSRSVERSVLQLQALVNQWDIQVHSDGGAKVEERLEFFWTLAFPTRWAMTKELAERWCSVGMLRSALEIYEQLEMWDEIISCYQAMDENEKAEKLVRSRLEIDTHQPKLWCILGDLTQDPSHWTHAWEISGDRYARAMRSLAAYNYKKQNFQECVICYQNALAINSLFENSWFAMGCAAMQLEQWEVALNAFLRCVGLENENGEAWNNLAAIYIRLDRKEDALRCFREGLKEKYDNSKMWENYLFLALDVGEFTEGLHATERLLNLSWGNGKSTIDVDGVRALIEGIVGLTGSLVTEFTALDMDGLAKPFRIISRAGALLDTITSIHASKNPELWSVYSRFHASQQDQTKALIGAQAAYRSVNQSAVGESVSYDHDAFEKLALLALQLKDTYLTANTTDARFQSRTILRNLVKRTQDNFGDDKLHVKLVQALTTVQD